MLWVREALIFAGVFVKSASLRLVSFGSSLLIQPPCIHFLISIDASVGGWCIDSWDVSGYCGKM